jgi:ribonuclease BN (tRNA processing enzyme)
MRSPRAAWLVASLIPFAATAQAPAAAAASDSTGTRVIMLGTGTPNADPDRSGPSVAIVVNGSSYLVDAGPGVVRRAAAAAAAGETALEMKNLKRVFITHLHSDHTLGLPDLIFSPWVLERTAPLVIYGPPGIKAMVDHISAAWKEDVEIRLNGGEPSNKSGWRAEPHEMERGIVYEDKNVKVFAFAVRHGAWKVAYGYRFRTADRTIVVSGDTGPGDATAAECQGCDVLVHEVFSAERFAGRPAAWQKYHLMNHTSTTQLAAIATKAKPKLLVLYHQLYWGATDEDLLREIAKGYAGKVESGKDLGIY